MDWFGMKYEFDEEVEEEEEEMISIRKTKESDVMLTSSKGKRNRKAIMSSTTKPSCTLKAGFGGSLRSEHRNRLRYLLGQLVRRQNWSEASGVLSVLLKGTLKDKSLSTNLTKYWATLEILQRMRAAKAKPRKILQVYDIWMKKVSGSTKGRFDVLQDYILFCLSQGDTDRAYQAVISLQQENDFRSEPIANLTVGLAFSQLWYNAFQKEMHLRDHSIGQSAFQAQVSYSSERDSKTCVRFGKEIDPKKEVVYRDRVVPMEVDHFMKKEEPEYDEVYMNYVESEESGNPSQFPHTGNKQYGSVFFARDVENLLVPSKLPSINSFEDIMSFQNRIQNDHYKAAVKHLRSALHSATPSVEALLPLVQMLVLGDQVKEAVEEVESVVQNSDAALPFRLRASLLDHFSNEDSNKLCICFEDTLTKDPTCRHSMLKLINLHHDGYYSIEKLVEMIALHLDATYADCHIWKEFASCFIRLVECDEDRMSSTDVSCTKRSLNIPDMFLHNTSNESWRLRCRWWRTRHFTQTKLASEVAAGNMELVAYKAASACHLYGTEFMYVVKADIYLKNGRNKVRSILKLHTQNAIGLSTRW